MRGSSKVTSVAFCGLLPRIIRESFRRPHIKPRVSPEDCFLGYPPNMTTQIVLSWTVDVSNSILSPAEAAAAMDQANVPLYEDEFHDPVLGQMFGLIVDTDNTTFDSTTATRTLTLDIGPTTVPAFPCHPNTSTPPTNITNALLEAETLYGSFFVSNGSTNVPTTQTQVPTLVDGDLIQFLSQQGVFYTIAVSGVSPTALTLTTPYTGKTANTGAFEMVPTFVKFAAIYSSSDLDTAGVATIPAIPAGPGAQTVFIEYEDSSGTFFAPTVSLTGRRPVMIPVSTDIASFDELIIETTGAFGNNIGQITIVELSAPIPDIPANATPGTGIGIGSEGMNTFTALTDQAQLLIKKTLVYFPPSYFSLAQQGSATPTLDGDFVVTTDSAIVFTENDQTAALAPTNIIEFASQLGVSYTVLNVGPKFITLTTPYSGIDENFTGQHNVNSNAGTKGNLGTKVKNKATDAWLVSPDPAAPPSNDQLAGPLAQFVDPGFAAPPPNPPLDPSTMTPQVTSTGSPYFLSGMYTKQLQLALAGVPVVANPITFA